MGMMHFVIATLVLKMKDIVILMMNVKMVFHVDITTAPSVKKVLTVVINQV